MIYQLFIELIAETIPAVIFFLLAALVIRIERKK
jgi:hypothetical protein